LKLGEQKIIKNTIFLLKSILIQIEGLINIEEKIIVKMLKDNFGQF